MSLNDQSSYSIPTKGSEFVSFFSLVIQAMFIGGKKNCLPGTLLKSQEHKDVLSIHIMFPVSRPNTNIGDDVMEFGYCSQSSRSV